MAAVSVKRSIVLPFAHQLFLLMNIFNLGSSAICHFSRQSDRKKEKSVVRLRMSRISFAAKHSWTTLRMSRSLFVGSYLRVTWWATVPNVS